MRKGSFRIVAYTEKMLKTSARLLQLLSLLQARRAWSGPELARELGITTRTVRNDVERLRDLGYPVHASPGAEGGYRLRPGTELPPLLLEKDEALAVAVGLRIAAAGTIGGMEEISLRALSKLEQVMPASVRRRVKTVQQAVVVLSRPAPAIDAEMLSTIAAACRDNDRLRFDYLSHDGAKSVRTTEPYRVVHDRRWYLVAWDLERSAFRTFRVDRMKLRLPVGPRFTPRDPPGGDLIGHVSRGLQRATWAVRARVKVHLPAAELSKRVPVAVEVEALDDDTCIASVGSESPQMLALYLGMLDADFEVIDAPEVRRQLRGLGERYLLAARPPRARHR